MSKVRVNHKPPKATEKKIKEIEPGTFFYGEVPGVGEWLLFKVNGSPVDGIFAFEGRDGRDGGNMRHAFLFGDTVAGYREVDVTLTVEG